MLRGKMVDRQRQNGSGIVMETFVQAIQRP
jgi:hypothetical protein